MRHYCLIRIEFNVSFSFFLEVLFLSHKFSLPTHTPKHLHISYAIAQSNSQTSAQLIKKRVRDSAR